MGSLGSADYRGGPHHFALASHMRVRVRVRSPTAMATRRAAESGKAVTARQRGDVVGMAKSAKSSSGVAQRPSATIQKWSPDEVTHVGRHAV